ncbi:MAG: hypothetical protein RR234_00230 [Christensenella sp.]
MLQKNKERFGLFLVLLFSFFAVIWTLSPANSLVFDDFTLLSEARFTSYTDLFRLLPSETYNDRSIRMVFLKMLNAMFGLSYIPYHIVFVIMHLSNVLLIFLIAKRILENFGYEKNKTFTALMAGAIFGIYPTSLMAVSSISSTCDLQCCNFMLLCFWFYLKAHDNKAYRVCYGVLCVSSFLLALRSKEMVLPLPCVFVIYEIALCIKNKKHVRITAITWSNIALMLVYASLLFGKKDGALIDADNPYYQSFSPITMLKNLVKYLFLYFDTSNANYTFSTFSKSAFLGVAFFCFVFAFSIWFGFRKKHWGVFLSILCAGGMFVTVLPMVNMQHRLYLYLPSVFLGFAFALAASELIELFKLRYKAEILIAAVLCLSFIGTLPGSMQFKYNWLNTCKQDQYGQQQLLKISKLDKNCKVYVKGTTESYNIFYYGQENVLRLIQDEPTLQVELVNDFPIEPQPPYCLIEYNQGEITEIKTERVPI